MDPVDPIEVLQELKDRPGFNLHEAYHISTFRGHRTKNDGTPQSFTLVILDAGPTLGAQARYIRARSKRMTG
jgi:hypothetical protein